MSLREFCVARGEVFIHAHDASIVLKENPDWDRLSRSEKMQRLQELEPSETYHNYNVTTVGLNESIVDNIDINQSFDREASHLAVGTDDSDTSSADTALGNEVARFSVTDTVDNGSEIDISTFIDTSEANGNTLKEVGLFTAASGGKMLNHALITDVVKTPEKTLTITVNMSFSSVSGSGDTRIVERVTTQTGDFTANNLDAVLADASSGAFSVTLPDPSDEVFVSVKKVDSTANAVNIETPGTETIDGETNQSITGENTSLSILSDGTNYFII